MVSGNKNDSNSCDSALQYSRLRLNTSGKLVLFSHATYFCDFLILNKNCEIRTCKKKNWAFLVLFFLWPNANFRHTKLVNIANMLN